MADYDFITTCNWTSTGTFTLSAYRGSGTNVVTSFSLFYRKKGAANWIQTTNGQIVIDSTGEWEVANNWNKSGNNVLTHSYYGITAINACTDVYFNESSLGNIVGNYFLYSCWYGCSSLASMPSGFNLPSGITTVGSNFLSCCWYGCSSLTSMPAGFNLPSGITTVGSNFLYACWHGCSSLASMPSGFNLPSGITTVGSNFLGYCWYGCSSLTSMPSGFNLPSGITTIGSYFLTYCWYNCTVLKADKYTENIKFEFSATNVFAGTCPITPDSVTATKDNPVYVAVNRLPSRPTNVSATDNLWDKITITWTPGTGETGGHRVYRNGTDVSGVVAHGTNTFDDYPDVGTYSYTVKAINDTGLSEASVPDNGTRVAGVVVYASSVINQSSVGEDLLGISAYSEGFSQTEYYGIPSSGISAYPEGFSQTEYGASSEIVVTFDILYAISLVNQPLVEELILQKSNGENLIAQNSSDVYEIITIYKNYFGKSLLGVNAYPEGFTQINHYGTPSSEISAYPEGVSQTEYGTPSSEIGTYPEGFSQTEYGNSSLELGIYPGGFTQITHYGTFFSEIGAYPEGFSGTRYGNAYLTFLMFVSYIYNIQQFGADKMKLPYAMASLQNAAYKSKNVSKASYGNTKVSGASYKVTHVKKDY